MKTRVRFLMKTLSQSAAAPKHSVMLNTSGVTHWKLLGVPMSALVSFFFLPLVFLSFRFSPLWLSILLRWYGCWWLWELWNLTLLISGFLMSTVAMCRAGPAHREGEMAVRVMSCGRFLTQNFQLYATNIKM